MTRALLAAALLVPLCGMAGAICAPRDVMLKSIEQRYGEVPAGVAVIEGGKEVMEVLISPKGSWTLIVTNTDEISCSVFGGEEWPEIEPPLPGKGA